MKISQEQKFQLQNKLNRLYKQKANIENEILKLEKQLIPTPSTLTKSEKIELFKTLFISRSDIYLKKWISKDLTKESFYPVTKTFRGEDYIPLENKDIEKHLRGEIELASYVVSLNNNTKFSILNLSKDNLEKLKETINKYDLNAYMEIDAKNEYKIWFFYDEEIEAKDSKAFLFELLKESNITGKIYPNVDFVNNANFGNYVELPLHLKHRENNLTIFYELNSEEIVYDQWKLLSGIKKNHKEKIIKISKTFEESKISSFKNEETNIIYPSILNMVLFDFVYVPLENLSKSFINELKSLATFENPQLKLLISLRKPLFNVPKFIKNFEEDEKYLKLPRGVLNALIKICKINGIEYKIEDKRVLKKEQFLKVKYELRDEQQEAIDKIMKKDFSICVAPPGFGKTLIGSKMIELRGVSSLVVVNKNMLLDQWIQRFVDYFGYTKKDVGFLGKSRNKLNGKLDIATMQSIKNQPEIIQNYSFVIVDECHHIPAVTFEQIIKQFCGKYLLGLSATPNRKDALEPILFQQLGNISYEYKKKRTLTHRLKVISSDFESSSDNYAQLINDIIVDERRNDLIINEILKYKNRKILVLTDRIEHINILEELLIKNNLNYVSIHGSMAKKQQDESLEKIEGNSLILATTSYFGEGIDFPHLNTIIFSTPISYYGRLVQYLGRVGRDGQECLAIDIVDKKNAMLNSTFKKRLDGYKQMHYKIY